MWRVFARHSRLTPMVDRKPRLHDPWSMSSARRASILVHPQTGNQSGDLPLKMRADRKPIPYRDRGFPAYPLASLVVRPAVPALGTT